MTPFPSFRPSVLPSFRPSILPSFRPKAFWSLYSGPLSVASNLAEWVELMYLNNLDYKALVGEGVTETEIASLYQVHQTNLDITADDIWTARSFGSDLLAHIVATMASIKSLPHRHLVKSRTLNGDSGRTSSSRVMISRLKAPLFMILFYFSC